MKVDDEQYKEAVRILSDVSREAFQKFGNECQISPEELKKKINEHIDAMVETFAQKRYETWTEQAGYVAWVPGGNSDKQEEARDFVRTFVRAWVFPE